ncbi:DEAD domain-containing protein [Heracleum sosnowskyi]|uniref:DEAD domain-containing protein n=1 Tax=Heracleum sosnowskyi TaxID=360622 RepID=A0AAD8HZY0_9APIA|nr:DEAD domain-containing protein [Heracleum sosnowskyi]
MITLQPNRQEEAESQINGTGNDDMEFGADLVFRPPARFLVDVYLEDEDLIEESTTHSNDNNTNYHPESVGGNFDLNWLRDACDVIVKGSSSQLPRDELAMAICRVLDSEKPGDEIAGDLLDLVGDSAFETVQDLITHRKELVDVVHHGIFVLKSDQKVPGSQSRMPSCGTRVTVQTESELQSDKLRRKEGKKKQRRGTDQGNDNELSSMSFSSLIQASEKKSIFDDLIGTGGESSATALPQGTVKKHHKGYEEVTVPPTQTAPMKPGEKLIEIKELDDFAQAAFQGYKSLNRIQSRIFQTTYNTNENILVCAPTGAGKTNIAMIAVLHEIGQHFKDGYLHKDEFKIVYVAPMKALAAEVTRTFSHR